MTHKKLIYLHPIPVRVWHWINASGFIILILTGLQIRFAEIFTVMPLRKAVDFHNYVGFAVIVNYGLWFSYYMVTGKIRIYFPELSTFLSQASKQVAYYSYGIFRGLPNPHHISPDNKFNALQKQAYLGIMFVFLPAQMVTGLFLWRIRRFEGYIQMLGGIKVVDSIHVLLFFFFTTFIFVHAYLATLGHTPLAHYKAMLTGYTEEY